MFWELCKLEGQLCNNLEKVISYREYMESKGNYDIFYSDIDHTITAIGSKSHKRGSRPIYFLCASEENVLNYFFKPFFKIS